MSIVMRALTQAKRSLSSLLEENESGQALVEYAFILLLVVITCVVMVGPIGAQAKLFYQAVQGAFAG